MVIISWVQNHEKSLKKPIQDWGVWYLEPLGFPLKRPYYTLED